MENHLELRLEAKAEVVADVTETKTLGCVVLLSHSISVPKPHLFQVYSASERH